MCSSEEKIKNIHKLFEYVIFGKGRRLLKIDIFKDTIHKKLNELEYKSFDKYKKELFISFNNS